MNPSGDSPSAYESYEPMNPMNPSGDSPSTYESYEPLWRRPSTYESYESLWRQPLDLWIPRSVSFAQRGGVVE